ncbi:MAG: LPS export ABC transporter periplasmic protein LptC [Proteobacteria bacterium]|nr:LPS export ABC transporter periplasmic protein LptC [Pseudomonadota bacterium]
MAIDAKLAEAHVITMKDATKDTYSRFVSIAKIGFPVLAALLLIGVFAFNKTNPIRDGVIVPGVGLAKLAVGQKITNPHYSGVTKSGDAFSISATSALPNAPTPDLVDLVLPRTTIDFADGLEVQTSSDFGQLNLNTQEAILTGTVSLKTSDDYQAHAEKIVLNFYTGNAYSIGPVVANGPIGHITAGKMRLTQDLHESTSHNGAILSFGNGVKLVYYPEKITNKVTPRE